MMKVYTSKPRYHWIPPQRFVDYVFFWTEWSQYNRDRYNEKWDVLRGVDTPEWAEKIADKLTPISKGIQWVLDKVHPEIKYVKVDYWDVWSMDYTLSPIILPMLKQLQKVKHGSGYVDLEDVPEHLRYTETETYDDQKTFDFYHEDGIAKIDCDVHTRYDWLLNELIWTFEQLQPDNDWEDQYWITKPELDFDKKEEDEGKVAVPVRWKVKGKCDWDARQKHQARIDNGLKLFGKYYQTFWD